MLDIFDNATGDIIPCRSAFQTGKIRMLLRAFVVR